ncbi:MAG: hypothetical protein ABI921_05830 [Panacibacter sp.]
MKNKHFLLSLLLTFFMLGAVSCTDADKSNDANNNDPAAPAPDNSDATNPSLDDSLMQHIDTSMHKDSL